MLFEYILVLRLKGSRNWLVPIICASIHKPERDLIQVEKEEIYRYSGVQLRHLGSREPAPMIPRKVKNSFVLILGTVRLFQVSLNNVASFGNPV